jgi:hypothetical protein
VIADVATPSAAIVVGAAEIVDVVGSAGEKVTTADVPIAAPFTVPVTVAVSVVVSTDDVNVAVYVPSPLSVTPESVPRVVASTTASPPCVRLTFPASLSCTVIVAVAVPFPEIVVGDAEITEVAPDGAFTTVTVASSVIATVLIVPVIVAVPAAADVNVAV